MAKGKPLVIFLGQQESLGVVAATTGLHGLEGELLRRLFWHSLLLAFFISVISVIQFYLLPGMLS